MAAETITIDSSSDDDSPPPNRRVPPTSNRAPAPRASLGESSSQQRRLSSANRPPQATHRSSTRGGPASARKSSGSSAPSGRGAGAQAKRKSIQLAITDSDDEEEEEEEEDVDELEVADAMPTDKDQQQLASSGSDDDDPITLRPSASPSKARTLSTASHTHGSASQARKSSFSNNKLRTLPSPRDNPTAALQRRPSSTRPSDGAEPHQSLADAKHPSSHSSSHKHTPETNDRALPASSNGSTSGSGSQRRFSAPMTSQSGRWIPRKSLQAGVEGSAPWKDRLSSPSEDETADDPGPSRKGASRPTTFDSGGNEILEVSSDDDEEQEKATATAQKPVSKQKSTEGAAREDSHAVKDDSSVAPKAEEARSPTSKSVHGGKRSSTEFTPPSPPKRRLSATLPTLAASAEIKSDWPTEEELNRPPSGWLHPELQAANSLTSGASTTAEDDQMDDLGEDDGETAQQEQQEQQVQQEQQLQLISDDEMDVDEEDERQISPELGLSSYTAAEKGKGRVTDLDQDDSALMPPPPLPPKRLGPVVATASELAEVTRIASALAASDGSDSDANAPPSTASETARKSTGAPIKPGYARKSTGGAPGTTLARKSVVSKPKPVAHASLASAGKRPKAITWAELIDLTGSTDEEDGGSEDGDDDEEDDEDEQEGQPTPMETDDSPRALSDVVEEQEPIGGEGRPSDEEMPREEEAAAEEPSGLADDLAEMSVTEEGAAVTFVETTIKHMRSVTHETSVDGAATKENVEVVSARLTRSGTRGAPAAPSTKAIRKKDAAKAAIFKPAPLEHLPEAPVETPAELERRAQAFMDRQRATRSSWRQIAGPSFPSELQEIEDIIRHAQLRDRRAKWANGDTASIVPDADDTALLESIIHQANLAHLPRAASDLPRVRVVPTSDGLPPYTPPWEFVYTHRVLYPPNVPPTQAPGCGCEGDCGSAENFSSCACRLRQQRSSTTKNLLHDPFPRSGVTGFAYTEHGRVKDDLFENSSMEPIIECNSECGCDDSCINRVVGKIPAISVDIFNTGRKGWAIRNPPSHTYQLWPGGEEFTHEGRVIKKGTPMGVYAAEMLPHTEGDQRCITLYNLVGRNYLFGLDHGAILEELRLQQPDLIDLARAAQDDADAATAASRGQKGKKKKQKSEKARLAGSKAGLRKLRDMGQDAFEAMSDTEEDSDGKPDASKLDPAHVLDAFFFGNWTRFANHSCSKFNTAVCPVFVDEADWSRPLYVFIASSDIQPGEEIAITYHGHRPELDDLDLATYKKEANEKRAGADKSWRCYCGEDLCRGVMFNNYEPDLGDDDEAEEEAKEARRTKKKKKKGKGRKY